MNNWLSMLEKREAEGRSIAVSLIGVGQMGAEIVATIDAMTGMDVVVCVDLSLERASEGYSYGKHPVDVVETNDLRAAEKALGEGRRVATTDYRLATRASRVDAVIDATGITEMAAQVSLEAIDFKKHIIMMSVECDVTIGPILRQMAKNAGVVYTLAAGDEPAVIIELYRFARTVGFTVVAAGKGKNNPLDIYANPGSVREKAIARKMNPRMLAEFVDGSKTAIEMTAVSNATGLVPDIRGMHGAKSDVASLNRVFVPRDDGGVLSGLGKVDYAVGVHPGVFLVVTTDNSLLREGMAQRDMGPGPYYTLYRPFHLTSIEVPISVCQAVLFHQSSGHPGRSLVSECITVSKRDIKKGELLDGIGETCYRGSIEQAAVARSEKLVPLGAAKGLRVTKDIPIDTPISFEMIAIEQETALWQLRRLQDMTYND